MNKFYGLVLVVVLAGSASNCNQKAPHNQTYRCNEGYMEKWTVHPLPHVSMYESFNPPVACTPEVK